MNIDNPIKHPLRGLLITLVTGTSIHQFSMHLHSLTAPLHSLGFMKQVHWPVSRCQYLDTQCHVWLLSCHNSMPSLPGTFTCEIFRCTLSSFLSFPQVCHSCLLLSLFFHTVFALLSLAGFQLLGTGNEW